MFKFGYQIIRCFLYPLIVWVLPLFSQSFRMRLKFENKNQNTNENFFHRSFKYDGHQADYAFEVSSEGELEQVRVLIEYLLKQGSKVELIYCSDSVEKQCQDLHKKYPDILKTLRLPILSYFPYSMQSPSKWLSAKTLFLCRYDFFPELIFYGKRKDVKMILLSGTMKNYDKYDKKVKNFLSRWYLNYVYDSFDKIVVSTKLDQQLLVKTFNFNKQDIETYDFRPIQIYKRIRNKFDHLKLHFPCFESFYEYLITFKKSKRVILGSYWSDEKVLTKELTQFINSGHQVTIVPHKLDQTSIDQIKEDINRLAPSLEIFEIGQHQSNSQIENTLKSMKLANAHGLCNNVLILNLKGVLCELYSLYGHAYVAGGFRSSVHSLLEPFLSECLVYCGPKVHRSTEYDLILQSHPDRIKVLENPQRLLASIQTTQLDSLSSMSSFKTYYEGNFLPLLGWLKLNKSKGEVSA